MPSIDKSELISLIETTLEQESGSLNEGSVAEDIEKWDSLGHLSVLVALDAHCDGQVASISEMASADSIPKIIEILSNNSLIKD